MELLNYKGDAPMGRIKEYYASAVEHWKCLTCGFVVGFIVAALSL
tara:strand:+ start:170 stop:304 length:135 start_codon:yes stop_codon:yes gene_type:complete